MENNDNKIAIDLIDDPAFAMRTDIDTTALSELSRSIGQVGLIEPIIVRPINGRYEVVAGHRRLMAAKMAGLPSVPCVVRDIGDDETETVKIHENLMREDVDPIDEAYFMARAMTRLDKGVSEFAKMCNRSEQYVRDRLAITEYDDYLIMYLKQKRVQLGVAKYLSQIGDPTIRRMYCDYAANNGVNIQVARMWYEESKRGILPQITDETPMVAVGETAPERIWTVRCGLCGDAVVVKTAKLVYGHKECADAALSTFAAESNL